MKRSTDRRWSPAEIWQNQKEHYARMVEHPPDKKAAENMKRKPYQNVDVLKYLQGKYKIGGDAGGAETGRKQCEK